MDDKKNKFEDVEALLRQNQNLESENKRLRKELEALKRKEENEWERSKAPVFWGEIAPTDHLVQIYESDEVVLAALEGFASSGFKAGDSVVVIATDAHLQVLNRKLQKAGFNLGILQASYQYMPLDAEKTLEKFMRNGWPNDVLFMNLVKEIVSLARGANHRPVRAYGEMVAILWGKGYNGATVHLEHLWNQFCETEAFCLFCAYPKSGFTQDAGNSIQHICSTHSKVISGLKKSRTEVFYKDVPGKRKASQGNTLAS